MIWAGAANGSAGGITLNVCQMTLVGDSVANDRFPVVPKVMGMPGDTVTVNWNRSDSATGTAETVVLDENGHATVTMTWTLGGDDLSEYEGWASLTATWPDGTEVTSREAKFKVKCKDNGRFNADERGRGPDID